MKRSILVLTLLVLAAFVVATGVWALTWNKGIPAVSNQISTDIPKIEQNFDYLWNDPGYRAHDNCTDQGATGCNSGHSMADIAAHCATTNCTLRLAHTMESITTTYQVKTELVLGGYIGLLIEKGAILKTHYAVSDGGNSYTWTNYSGFIYVLDQTINNPTNVYQAGVRLTEKDSLGAMTTAGTWCYTGSKLYVWSTDNVDPDTLAGVLIEVGYKVTINTLINTADYQIFDDYGDVYFTNWGLEFNSGWWQNADIYYAAQTVTVGGKLKVTRPSTVSHQVVMDVQMTYLECANWGAFITPSQDLSGEYMFLITNASSADIGTSIVGCNIDGRIGGAGSPVASGIKVSRGWHMWIDNNFIQYTQNAAIYLECNVATYYAQVEFGRNWLYFPDTQCIYIYNGPSCNESQPLTHFADVQCFFPAEDGIYIYNEGTNPNRNLTQIDHLGVQMSFTVGNHYHTWPEDAAGAAGNNQPCHYALKVSGVTQTIVKGGWIEGYVNATAGAQLSLSDITMAARIVTDKALVADTGTKVCCTNCNTPNYRVYSFGKTWCVGRTDTVEWGPPNQSIGDYDEKSTHAYKYQTNFGPYQDAYGNNWRCTFGGTGGDNSTWISETQQLVIPVDYSMFASHGYNMSDPWETGGNVTEVLIFYPQDEAIIKHFTFWPSSLWTNDDANASRTKIWFGCNSTNDNETYRFGHAWMKPKSELSLGNYFSMFLEPEVDNGTLTMPRFIRGAYGTTPYPNTLYYDLSVSAPRYIGMKTNTLTTGATWSSGAGFIILDIVYPYQRTWWFR